MHYSCILSLCCILPHTLSAQTAIERHVWQDARSFVHISKRSPRGFVQCRRANLIVLRGLDIKTKPEGDIVSGTVWI